MKQFIFSALIFVLSASSTKAAGLKEVHSSLEIHEDIKILNIDGDFCKIMLQPSSE